MPFGQFVSNSMRKSHVALFSIVLVFPLCIIEWMKWLCVYLIVGCCCYYAREMEKCAIFFFLRGNKCLCTTQSALIGGNFTNNFPFYFAFYDDFEMAKQGRARWTLTESSIFNVVTQWMGYLFIFSRKTHARKAETTMKKEKNLNHRLIRHHYCREEQFMRKLWVF